VETAVAAAGELLDPALAPAGELFGPALPPACELLPPAGAAFDEDLRAVGPTAASVWTPIGVADGIVHVIEKEP
jgi:hypothetical protein